MKRSVIAVVAAAVLAVLGCLAVLVYVKGADARALAGKRAVSVVVATKRIPAGTTGTRIRSGGYVEVVSMPQAAVPALKPWGNVTATEPDPPARSCARNRTRC